MEPEQYNVMLRREDRHWWYAGMRRAATGLLAGVLTDDPSRLILDAGCGTGGTSVRMGRFGTVYGVDLAWAALLPAQERGLAGRLARGSVESLPFGSGTFDVATSFEVLYHLQVGSDAEALNELRRVLKNNGLLLLRLPAHDWLRGSHDRLVHTRRRYQKGEVGRKLEAAGFEVLRLSWANSALFLPAAAKRLMESRGSARGTVAEPDLWQPPGPINALLEAAVAMEAVALPHGVPLPFGLSVIALARAL